MTDLINWVIPKDCWELCEPSLIQRYHEILNEISEKPNTLYSRHKETLERYISKVIDKQHVDINDIITYWDNPHTLITPCTDNNHELMRNLNIDKQSLFSKTIPDPYEHFYEKVFDGCKVLSLTTLCVEKEIKDLLEPDAAFKVKVRGSYRYHEKDGRIYHDWAVSVTTLISSDNLMLLKLSMD